MKIIKKDYENRQEINIKTYLEKKKIKNEYGINRRWNMPEEDKKRIKIYQKNCREAKTSQCIIIIK